MLTNRMISIMENIIDNASGIKVRDFAALYAVSNRVIYYDLEELSYYAKQEKLPFTICVQGGIVTCVCKEQGDCLAWRDYVDSCLENVVYAPEERLLEILYRLLRGNPAGISSLIEEMGVSKSTVVNDMDSIKQFYKSYDVKVLTATKRGFYLAGKEEDICIASYHYLFSLLRYNNVIDRIYTDPDIWRSKPYRNYLGKEQFIQIATTVMSVLKESNLSYQMINDCICAVLVMVARDIPESTIFFSEEYRLLKNTEIFHTAELIVKEIGDLYPRINKEDFACFLALCMLRPGANYHLTLSLYQSVDFGVLAANFANKVCACFGVPVSNSLLNDIKNDMFLLITRPDMLLQTYNEKFFRVMNIKQEYEQLYKIVKENSTMISAAFRHELTDRQIVYLMLNFVELYEHNMGDGQNKEVLLVCNNTSVLSKRLSDQLQIFFDIHIVATVSLYEMNAALDKYKPECIISTIPIMPGKTKCIFVNQFLSKNDISELSVFFALRKTNFGQEDLSLFISEIQDDVEQDGENLSSVAIQQCICLDAEYYSISEAVHAGGELLKEQGFIEEEYIEEIEKAVRENGRFMLIGPDIIMPHSIVGNYVYRTGISIIRLKNPVRLEDVDVEVNWIFTLCAVDRKSHLKALTQLTNIIGDEEKMRYMKEAASAAELHMFLEEN